MFGDVNELGGANSAMSPRAYALSGRHLTSDPNPMGTFSRQSPGAMGHPGTPPALAAQSALLRQQLHAAALNGETSAASGHQQRPWSVADMATSLGLDQLYSHGDRKLQDNADAMYAGADRPHSDPNAAQLSAAQGMRGNPGGLSQHMYSQAQQAVAHLAGKDRPSQRVSMGGEEPSNSGAGGLSAQHLQQLPQSAQAAYGVSGAPHSAPIDPTQAGAAGNDPFLQLLQGLKVAKALQGGGGDPEEAQQQDSHYRALVQMLAHRNAQMPQQQQRRPAGSPGEAGGGMNGIVSAPAVPHHSTGAPDTVMGASSHSLSGAYDGRVNPGRPGSVAGLEDMHALASLVAHSAGMPSAPDGGSQPGYLPGGLGGGAEGMGGGVLEGQAGLNGGGKPDQHQQPTDMGIPNMMNTNVPMDASAAPHGFNGGSGSTWDVSDKQMQVCLFPLLQLLNVINLHSVLFCLISPGDRAMEASTCTGIRPLENLEKLIASCGAVCRILHLSSKRRSRACMHQHRRSVSGRSPVLRMRPTPSTAAWVAGALGALTLTPSRRRQV